MSEEAKEATKKKGKLPIIIVLALVLGGGGFFVMKSKSAKKEQPKIELAEAETELGEFLVNLKDGTVYLRAKISVKLAKDFSEEKLKANLGSVEDAVNLVLRDTSAREIVTGADLVALKKKLAKAMNARLKPPVDPKEEKEKPKDEKKEGAAKAPPPNPAWDSQEGPILQVFFKSFATQ